MQIGIFAKTFGGTHPSVVLGAVRAAGYRVAQYNMACSGLASMPDAIPPGITEAIGAAANETSIGIAAVSGTYNMIHPDPAVRRRGHDSLAVICAAAPAMGTRLVTLCTGTRDPDDQWRRHSGNDAPEAWRDLLASMEIALAFAEKHDVDLGVEPERANVIDSAAKALRLIETMGSPRLKIVLDPANLVEAESLEGQRRIVADAVDRLARRIAIAHAKDRGADGRVVPAGSGTIDLPFLLRRLASIGFDGPVITHGLSAAEAPGAARFLERILSEAER